MTQISGAGADSAAQFLRYIQNYEGQMAADDKEWKKLSFAQRVGAEPLPAMLKPEQLSNGLRVALWTAIYNSVDVYRGHITGRWKAILYRKHLKFDHLMPQHFTTDWPDNRDILSDLFQNGNYIAIYGLLEFILRDPDCPGDLVEEINGILKDYLAPYEIIDGDTLMPIASPEQAQLLSHALEQLKNTPMAAASAHLKHAIEFLNKGQWAKSIAESIHAVESVARKIEPGARTLDPALDKLAKKIDMHPALKGAFSKLYGFTSDEQGIRHALIDKDAAAVDRDDAIFMLTACATFSSYLVNKAKGTALL